MFKFYSYLKQTTNGEIKDSMKVKWINKCVKKQCLTHQDYVDAVKFRKTTRCVKTVFKTYEHCVFTQDENKIAISPHDDKRIWLKDYISMTYQHTSPTLTPRY